MFFAALLVTCGVLLGRNTVNAQTCWRDTTCTGPTAAAFPGTWDQYNFSPTSRTVTPVKILNSDTSFLSNYPGTAQLSGNGSQLVFDFGQEVGGILTITYGAAGTGTLGAAFTEAKNFTGENSDSSNGNFHTDGALYASFTTSPELNYTMPVDRLRGGFRYLTLFIANGSSTTEVSIQDITVEIAYAPTWSNLRAYQGYFYSSDDLLNRIWYSGAFTLQTNNIPPSTGRELLGSGWENNQNLDLGTSGESIYVDGSKRDRTVWAGDLAIAVPSILVGTGDAEGVKNTIQVLYNDQQSTGELPFAGPALNIFGSDTYHMASMIGLYDYYLYTKDDSFLSDNWSKYELAMSFITGKIDSTGLLDVTGTNDWGRLTQGGHNTEANMLLYHVLTTGSSLANWQNDASYASSLTSLAANLKAAVNNATYNWDPAVGAFKDSDTDGSIHPEDGNSMALLFGAADASYVSSISQQLTTNWGPIGAVAPELPNNLVGFGQSFEVKGHLAARQATRALDLIRLSWGWYINNPDGTASTCIEGYLSDGTFGYRSTEGYDMDPSYTSHAHGWSTGPVDALTSWIVGMQLTAPGGSEWTLAPQFGDLTHAEAGFVTPLGPFQASWTTSQGGYTLSWEVPAGTTGVLILPAAGTSQPTVEIDGQQVQTHGLEFNAANGTVTMTASGGSHKATVTY